MPVLLAVILLLVLLVNNRGILAPDIKPEIYMAPWREAEALSRAWRESPKLGEPNFNVGLFPVAVVVGLIQALGVDADLSMRLLRWVLLLVGAWGTVRLYDLVAGPRRRISGRIAAGVLFVANPYMVTAGDFLAIVLPGAMLPWMCLFFLRACVRGGWHQPASAALAFAAMSGMNAAVIPLIQLVCLPALWWFAVRGLGAAPRRVLAATGRWGLLVLLISAYWLLPSIVALGAGSHVTHFSETLAGIAGPSSFAEVLRGLGLWPLYGRDVDGPWQPGFAAYLVNPVVVAATFALPLLFVAAGRVVQGPARRFALLLALPAAVLMVGAHPVDAPSPFGHLLLWSFEHVPGAAAFRTTNKAGAVLFLGMVLLIALAVPRLVEAARRRLPIAVVAGAAITALVASTWPAWTGGLYSLPLPVPGYWYAAAKELDQGSPEQRVWFVPGVAQPQYTWSEDRPDDLNNALLARPSFVRITLPESSPYGASLLAAVDTGLQEGSLPAGTLSAAARYLGVGDVLVRNDVRWDKAGGARPLAVATAVGSDPGLTFIGADGRPGEGVLRTEDQPPLELQLPPLQRYAVAEPKGVVRTESAAATVLVDGDGWALAPLLQAGLLEGQPPFLLASATNAGAWTTQPGGLSRVVLTDTNRRRHVAPNRLTNAYGALLPADAASAPTIALGDADEQTVLTDDGGQVSAGQQQPLFGLSPASSPENAVDGNPATAWTFGDFGRARGQSVSVRPDRAVAVDTVGVDIPPTTGQRITAIRVAADEASIEASVPTDGRVTVHFPGRTAKELTVTVTGVDGEGDNPVGISEIAVPGLQVRRVARLPVATVTSLRALDPEAATQLRDIPTDVVLTRVRGQVGSADDEEARLERDFTLPADREFRVYGLIRPDDGASDELLDRLNGVTGDAVATSSSRAHSGVENRASRAFDGNPATGWAPGRAIRGEWLSATFDEPRTISRVVVEQPADAAAWVTKADIILDGQVVTSADLGVGRVDIPVPATSAREVRIRVTDHAGAGVPVISEVDVDGARLTQGPETDPCTVIGSLDGQPLRVRLLDGVAAEGVRLVAGCDSLTLSAGEHRLRSTAGWVTDSLVLRDTSGESVVPGETGPAVQVDRRSASSYDVRTTAADVPYLLVLGQNVHPSWTATMDGRPMGPPTVIDGYAMGWRVTDLRAHRFEIVYGPQRGADFALGVSAAGVLLSAGLAWRPGGPGREAQQVSAAPEVRRRHTRRRLRHRWPSWLTWGTFVLASGVLAGVAGLVAAIAVVLWRRVRPLTSRGLLRAAAAAMALAPLAWILGNLGRWGEISPQLVVANPAPSILVVCSLVWLAAASRDDGSIGDSAAGGQGRADEQGAGADNAPGHDHRADDTGS